MPTQPVQTGSPRLRGASLYVLLILLLGLALRVPGLFWGLPDITHPYWSYHPDETLHLQYASDLGAGRLAPRHFQYGGTLYYAVLNLYQYIGQSLSGWLGGYNALANAMIAGRIIGVVTSMLTIVVTYAAGRRLSGEYTALLATLLLAVTPVHAILTRSVRPDEISTLIASLELYGAALLLDGDHRHENRLLCLLGLMTGIATAMRFPLAVFAAAPVTACLVRDFGSLPARRCCLQALRAFALITVFGAVGYALASPLSLLRPDLLRGGMEIQRSYQAGLFLDSFDRGSGLLQYGWRTLREGMGWPIYALMICGLLSAVIQRSKVQLVLLSAVIPYFFLLTLSSWVVVRYTMPLMPALCLLAAGFIALSSRLPFPWRPLVGWSFVPAASWTLVGVVAFLQIPIHQDVRDTTRDWIIANAPTGTPVVDVQSYIDDVYYNPPAAPDYPSSHLILARGLDLKRVLDSPSPYILVVNQSVYGNIDRLGQRHPLAESAALGRLLAERFQLITELHKPVEWMGLHFDAWFTSQDYQIMNPGIRIYEFDPRPKADIHPVASP